MKSLKTRIFAATLLSAIALSQPAQLQAINLTPNQKLGLGLVAGVTVTGMAAAYAFMDSAYTQQMKKYKTALGTVKPTASHEQITVKKGEMFTIERQANLEIGQQWSVKNPEAIPLVGLACATENPGKEESLFYTFKAKEAGVHTMTFTSSHKPVNIPLKSGSNAHMRFVDYVTVTVTVEDDAAEETVTTSALETQTVAAPAINTFELAEDKTSTHITVKEGQEFTIAAPRTGNIKANFIEPYITGALTPIINSDTLLPWNGKRLQDKDIFEFTARKKGIHKVHIDQRVQLEKNKSCTSVRHHIFVHVE
jgi:hypothetical protein